MIVRDIHIASMGAATPVGRDVWSSAAAVRAGICGFREHPFMVDTAGEPIRVAMASWLDAELSVCERLATLLFAALDEAMSSLTAREEEPMRVGLALALPLIRPGFPQDLPQQIKEKISGHYGDKLELVALFPLGHAAGFVALESAIESLQKGRFDACIVAGVDSYMAPETLAWLEDCDQLHGAGPLNNAWGFIPGEAAGALLLAKKGVLSRYQLDNYGRILSVGLGTERCLIKTESSCLGEGLTQAFRTALAGMPGDVKVHNVYCDMNGEPYRANEYGLAVLRTRERFESATDFIAPADCWGDIGAAGMPLCAMLALISQKKHYSNGALSLVWSSSENGERGAGLIEAGGKEGY